MIIEDLETLEDQVDKIEMIFFEKGNNLSQKNSYGSQVQSPVILICSILQLVDQCVVTNVMLLVFLTDD